MDAMSLWGLNQSTPVISYLARSTKADEAISASPYTLSMAQSSVRGACGFVHCQQYVHFAVPVLRTVGSGF